jgi:hypothetical protein
MATELLSAWGKKSFSARVVACVWIYGSTYRKVTLDNESNKKVGGDFRYAMI